MSSSADSFFYALRGVLLFQSVLDCILNEWCHCPPFTELAALSSHSAVQWEAFSALLNGDGTMGTQHQKLCNTL